MTEKHLFSKQELKLLALSYRIVRDALKENSALAKEIKVYLGDN